MRLEHLLRGCRFRFLGEPLRLLGRAFRCCPRRLKMTPRFIAITRGRRLRRLRHMLLRDRVIQPQGSDGRGGLAGLLENLG